MDALERIRGELMDKIIIVEAGSGMFFLRDLGDHRYAAYVADGEGFGAGAPWEQMQEKGICSVSAILATTGDSNAILVEKSPDKCVIGWDSKLFEPVLLSPEEADRAAEEETNRWEPAEAGDMFAMYTPVSEITTILKEYEECYE